MTAFGAAASRWEIVERALTSDIDQGLMPGFALRVWHRGTEVLSLTKGKQNVRGGTDLPHNAIFSLDSLSKCLLTVCALGYFERGAFNMNDPISRHLPIYRKPQVFRAATDPRQMAQVLDAGRPPSVRELLTHTAGVMYTPAPKFASRLPIPLPFDFLMKGSIEERARKLADVPLLYEPGTEWRYSHGLEIIAWLMETLEEADIESVFIRRLSSPLGLGDLGYSLAENARTRFAFPDSASADAPLPGKFVAGSTGLYASADDCLKVMVALVNGLRGRSAVLLGRKTLEYALSDQTQGRSKPEWVLPDGEHFAPVEPGFGFGMGFAVCTEPCAAQAPASRGAFYWSGAGGSILYADPVEDLAIVYLANVTPRVLEKLLFPSQRSRQRVRTLVYQAI